jgi:alkanesulfonate monooxygenase SsuD/methylene tetrahydromethanopterin reductase-like flavin-dependent oxidoreductase (luciferase family)
MSGEAFSFAGKHYTISDHRQTPEPVQKPHPPLIVGGGGKRVLSIAAREADIVGINPNLRAGTAGPEVAPQARPDVTKQRIEWVKEAAGPRFADIELNVHIGFVMVTDDAMSIAEAMAPAFDLPPEEVLHVPLALVGTVDWMIEELQRRREEYGFSYFVFEGGNVEALAPVVARLAGI